MTVWFTRCALGVSAIFISACGAAQTPIGTVPVQNVVRGSWILPQAMAQDLVYFSTVLGSGGPSTYIFSLREGTLVGQLNVGGGLCSDNVGNVWIADGPTYLNKKKLTEYAHGEQRPIKTLHIPNMTPTRCAVDPASGNVAVVDGGQKVDIFDSGSSRPKIVTDESLYLDGVTYDGSGDLFVLGGTIGHQKPQQLKVGELPKGAAKVVTLRGFQTDRTGSSGFEWDGKDLTLGDGLNEGGHEIFRYEVGRNRLMSHGVVELANGNFAYLSSYWVHALKAVATAYCDPYSTCAPIYVYDYPLGGQPIREIGTGIVPSGGVVTISVAQE